MSLESIQKHTAATASKQLVEITIFIELYIPEYKTIRPNVRYISSSSFFSLLFALTHNGDLASSSFSSMHPPEYLPRQATTLMHVVTLIAFAPKSVRNQYTIFSIGPSSIMTNRFVKPTSNDFVQTKTSFSMDKSNITSFFSSGGKRIQYWSSLSFTQFYLICS